MKKILLTLFTFTIIVQFGFSQINYTFELDSAEYVPIEEDFSVISGFEEEWGGDEYWENIPIGFSLMFLGEEFSAFDLYVDEIDFVEDELFFTPYEPVLSGDVAIFPNPDDSTEYYFPPIIYKTIGENGNRMFILEYKDAQFWAGGESYYTNYQVKLYEKNNALEIHYGSGHADESVYINGPGPSFEISNETTEEFIFLTGDPLNPQVVTENSDADTWEYSTLDYLPPEGVIYRFVPNEVDTDDLLQNRLQLKITPNPASDYIRLILPESTEAKSMQITNALGQVVYQSNLSQKRIDIVSFLPGMYYLKVMDEKGQTGVASFIKIE